MGSQQCVWAIHSHVILIFSAASILFIVVVIVIQQVNKHRSTRAIYSQYITLILIFGPLIKMCARRFYSFHISHWIRKKRKIKIVIKKSYFAIKEKFYLLKKTTNKWTFARIFIERKVFSSYRKCICIFRLELQKFEIKKKKKTWEWSRKTHMKCTYRSDVKCWSSTSDRIR